jgi:hypothetical protein
MANKSEPERPVALSLSEIWRAETLAPLFRPWIVLRVVAVVTVVLVVLAFIELRLAGDHPDLKLNALSNLVTWIGGIYAFSWGVYTYGDKKEQSNKEPFLKEQLRLCFRASELAATLATESDCKKWEEARKEFWQLYWGPLSIVEAPAVESAMVDLGQLIPTGPVDAPKLPMTSSLGVPSYKLAHAVRDLVLASWNVDLPPLQGKRERWPMPQVKPPLSDR